jgi:multimeric flavodoxin WrbA
MTVTAFVSSPRKRGNSTILARQLLQGAEEAGAQIREVALSSLRIRPCKACEYCKRDKTRFTCSIQDDMQDVYEAVKGSEVLVLASPIYCFTVSAQLKLFMDRCYALWSPGEHPMKEKRIAAILTYGDADEASSGVRQAIATLEANYRFLECPPIDLIHCSVNDPGEVLQKAQVLARAHELGSRLASA